MLKIKEILKGEDETLFRMMCSTDPAFFVERVIGPHIHLRFKLADFQRDMIKTLMINDDVNIIAFRGSLKTTLTSVGLPLYLMAFKPKEYKFIGLTSSSMKYQSVPIFSDVQRIIRESEFLNYLKPEDSDISWNKEEINTTTGCKYVVVPFSDSARSKSMDLMIFDDILRSEDISQEKIKEIFWQVFYSIAKKRDGKLWLVNTPQAAHDLVHELKNENKGFKTLFIPKCTLDNKGTIIKSTWDRYSIEQLEFERSRIGDIAFSKEMLCLPYASKDNIFPYDILEPVIQKDFMGLNKGLDNKLYFLGMDIALSQSNTADYTAISVMEKGEDGVRQVYLERFKGIDSNTQISKIEDLHKRFHFTKILVEEVGLSISMVADMKDYKIHPEIAHFVEGYKTNTTGKEMIIGRFKTAILNKTVHILDHKGLIQELGEFNIIEKHDLSGNVRTTYEGIGQHDDCAMATFLSFEASTMVLGVPSMAWITHE